MQKIEKQLELELDRQVELTHQELQFKNIMKTLSIKKKNWAV
jgi:hypothetical protein